MHILNKIYMSCLNYVAILLEHKN